MDSTQESPTHARPEESRRSSAGLHRLTAALATAAVLVVGLVTAGSAQAATTPPWEPDPNAVGTLSFYDAAGNVITSGKTDVAPFAAYVAGSTTIRSGDVSAAVYFANPEPGKTPVGFFREQVGVFTGYPTTTGPAAINTISNTRPVNKGDAGDQSLDGFESDSIVSTAAGYQNIVQVRLRTATPAGQIGVPYESADVMVNPTAHTWTQVYPAPAATTAPAAPTGVSAVAGNAQATVSFTAPSSNGGSAITGYKVEYAKSGTTTFTTFTSTATASPVTVTGLTNGTSYVFRVSAINSVGTGAASATSTAVTPSAPNSAPAAPTNVKATAGDAQATVTWTAPTNTGGSAVTGYKLEYAVSGGTSYITFPTTGAGTSATVTGLTNGTSYVFRVSAINAIGTSAPSAPSAAVTPKAPTAPAAPANVQAVAGNAQATVTWTAPTDNGGSTITGYNVEYAVSGTTTFTTFATTGTGTSATVTGLTNGTSYVFRVSAINAIGTSTASAAGAPVTPAVPASTPTAFAIGGATTGKYGAHSSVIGRLTDSSTHAQLEGETVSLLSRPDSHTPFARLKTVTTDSTGLATVVVPLTANADYKWTYAGSATHLASTSPIRTIIVSQTIAVHVTASKVNAGALIKIYGTVGPVGNGQPVYLQKQSGSTWKNVTTVQIRLQALPDGTTTTGYLIGLHPAKGSAVYRVYKQNVTGLSYGTSSQFPLSGA